jgi:predicted dehydrogenase
MIKIGVVGYGYWGPNLVRNFMNCPESTVTMIADRRPERLKRASEAYPQVEVTHSTIDLIKNSQTDAIVIATPVHTHFELARSALQEGKHVLVEKPITSTSGEAEFLIELAEKSGLVLMVDHTFVYTSAVRKLKELVFSDKFGAVRYFDSTRVNLGVFQSDVNVLWDLAVHDLSIMDYVLSKPPRGVSATGYSHLRNQPEYAAFLTVFFDDMIGHINVNWMSPVKIRRTLVGGANQLIVFDDLESAEKIKVYDSGITVTHTSDDKDRFLIGYRTGDLWSPRLQESEALAVEASHFASCILRRERPITGGIQGLQLVRILEAANRSLRLNGAPETL